MKKSGKHFPISFETLNLDKLLTRRQEKAFSVKLLASTHASMYRERERERHAADYNTIKLMATKNNQDL